MREGAKEYSSRSCVKEERGRKKLSDLLAWRDRGGGFHKGGRGGGRQTPPKSPVNLQFHRKIRLTLVDETGSKEPSLPDSKEKVKVKKTRRASYIQEGVTLPQKKKKKT